MIPAPSTVPTEPRRLDEAVARVREAAPAWARAPIEERIALAADEAVAELEDVQQAEGDATRLAVVPEHAAVVGA